MPGQIIIDRDTYRSIKKMSREELQGDLLGDRNLPLTDIRLDKRTLL